MRRIHCWLLIGWFFTVARTLVNAPTALADEPADPAARQAELQRKYPFESLRERLAYEQLAPKRSNPPAASEGSAENDSNLTNGITVFSPRIYSLRLLHSAKADEFSRVLGNGQSRMPAMSPATILEKSDRGTEFFKLDASPVRSSALGAEQPLQLPKDEGQGMNPGRAPSLRLLNYYRDESEHHNFGARSSFGFVESIDRVVGFIPHKFYWIPKVGHDHWLGSSRVAERVAKENTSKFDLWRSTQLQLVSLLKHPEPRVYVSEHLPNMSELVNAQSRELSAFEQSALDQLQEGEQVVTAATTNTIQMLGALRAKHDCLECHSVKYGTLLGAFSYTLERDPPISAKQLGVLNQQTAATSSARPTGAQRTTTTPAALPQAPRAAKR